MRVLVVEDARRLADAIARGLRAEGIGIVVASSEPETILSLADRIVVMRRGAIACEFAGEAVSKDHLLAAA